MTLFGFLAGETVFAVQGRDAAKVFNLCQKEGIPYTRTAWDGESFVLLHQFMKKTQKTPREEIQKAKRNLSEYRERRIHHEKEPKQGDSKKKS